MDKKTRNLMIFAVCVLIISLTCGIIGLLIPKTSKDSDGSVSTMGYGKVDEAEDLSQREKMTGFVSVCDYGADGLDTKDDTDAFEKAISKNIAVFVPAGTYYLSRPLAFNDQNFYGEGESVTFIVSTLSDAEKPIMYIGGSTTVSALNISYDSSLITGEEKRNERVAISCGAAVGYGPGGGVRDVAFENVGTAIRSDNTDGFGSNNCVFERINVKNVSFCGFDFTVSAGYGNIFSRIMIESSKATAGLMFDGVGGTDTIEQISFTNCKFEYGVGYTELSGVIIDEPIISNTEISKMIVLCTDK